MDSIGSIIFVNFLIFLSILDPCWSSGFCWAWRRWRGRRRSWWRRRRRRCCDQERGRRGASPDTLLTIVIFIVYIKYCYSKHIQILRCINIPIWITISTQNTMYKLFILQSLITRVTDLWPAWPRSVHLLLVTGRAAARENMPGSATANI